jgi:hypothetical protein
MGKLRRAERCLNNASEHFIKLGDEPGEAAVLRLLAELYIRNAQPLAARRCLERVVLIGRRYRLSTLDSDRAILASLLTTPQSPA